MPRRKHPDWVMDADRGASDIPGLKVAAWLTPSVHADREEIRAGHREVDELVEGSTGYTRAAKDAGRSTPRDTTAPLGHPRMIRHLPDPDRLRVPLSSRQRKARSKAKMATLDTMPNTEYQAMGQTISRRQVWLDTNEALSVAAGDAQQLPADQLREIQRVDRSIQRYERGNERSHLVYTNVLMPAYINASNINGYARNNFEPGQEVTFDRYTAGAQTMHEIDLGSRRLNDRTVVFEIATRRGMYLGRSDSLDDTAHLLPRGLRTIVAGSHTAEYMRPDGTRGHRTVVQLVDAADPGEAQ